MRKGLLLAALATAAGFLLVISSDVVPVPAAPQQVRLLGEPARVYEGTIALPTAQLAQVSYTPSPIALDEVDLGYPIQRTDRNRYDWGFKSAPQEYRTVVLENEYLKVTLLPELGGRLYEAVFKPTGEQVFYRTDKLTPYGLWNCGREWMYATGGLRFEFPTWGHDPNTERPAACTTATHPDGSASATCTRTDAATGLRLTVRVTLDAGRSWVRLNFALSNPTDRPERAQVWTITGLMGTPGIEFIVPTEYAIFHGGDRTYRWPVYEGVDWAYFRNWPGMQSLFALDWKSGFSGLYDHTKHAGVVRCARAADTPGLKLWGEPRSMERYYVSLYGGITQTMEEKIPLAPGAVKTWEERWYPVAGTGGLTEATSEVALSLHTDGGNLVAGIIPTRACAGARVRVTRGAFVLLDKTLDLSPARACVETVPLAGDAKTLAARVVDADGRVLLEATCDVAAIRPVFRPTEPQERRR